MFSQMFLERIPPRLHRLFTRAQSRLVDAATALFNRPQLHVTLAAARPTALHGFPRGRGR